MSDIITATNILIAILITMVWIILERLAKIQRTLKWIRTNIREILWTIDDIRKMMDEKERIKKTIKEAVNLIGDEV